jgi:RNA polymerase subunit RPABC4/transcription elongation factor Spt4
MTDAETEDAPFDPTRRKLCPDGACVGVIGDDGVCRVCGRTEAQAAAGEDAPELDAQPGGDGGGGTTGGGATTGGFDSKRRLCDDGSCVGVVGDDGVCRVCGRRSESSG